jgi:hypothetical protein
MAQLYVSGPCALHVSPPNSIGGTPLFLGHGVTAPTINIEAVTVPVKCDVGGAAEFERIYSGEVARVQVDLVRYNFTVLMGIQARARTSLFPASVGGIDEPGMLGSLMISEGACYQLYVTFLSAFKPQFNIAMGLNSGGPMLRGYHFYNATLDPERVTPGSANPLSWTCLRLFDPSAPAVQGVGGPVGFGKFTLYDQLVQPAIDAGIN